MPEGGGHSLRTIRRVDDKVFILSNYQYDWDATAETYRYADDGSDPDLTSFTFLSTVDINDERSITISPVVSETTHPNVTSISVPRLENGVLVTSIDNQNGETTIVEIE